MDAAHLDGDDPTPAVRIGESQRELPRPRNVAKGTRTPGLVCRREAVRGRGTEAAHDRRDAGDQEVPLGPHVSREPRRFKRRCVLERERQLETAHT